MAAPSADSATDTAAARWQETFLEVDINQQRLDETVLLLRAADGSLLAAAADLARWRLRAPDAAPVSYQGSDYYRLQAIPGLSYRLDETAQTLAITTPPAGFETTHLSGGGEAVPTPRADPGLFLNYDLLAEGGGGEHRLSGLFELGVFNRYGVGTVNVLAPGGQAERHLIRLEAGWTLDLPEHMSSLRLGDAISRPASLWGRAVRFGGIQYGSKFATRPGFVALPQQSIHGAAALPSTVDVFVNNALVSRREVPPGPFSVNNIPVVTGQGDVRLVVRDLLGREQVISQPFYASASLLRAGLSDFSYEAGALRENLGSHSNDYGRWLAAGTFRHGVSDSFTGEVHGEAMEDGQRTLGVNGVWLRPELGVFHASLAGSRSAAGSGRLFGFGFEHSDRDYSFGGRTQAATEHFAQIGLEPGQPAPRRTSDLHLGFALGRGGRAGLGYVFQDNRDGQRAEFVSFNYTVNLGPAFVGISALKSLGGQGERTLGVFISIPLGAQTTSNFSLQRSQDQTGASSRQLLAELQHSLPLGEGYGYRLQATSEGARLAGVAYQNEHGVYSAEAAHAVASNGNSGGDTRVRLGAAGGLAALGGQLFLSRPISDSFALVQVPGYAAVRVYADNQLVARTDAEGNAVVPRIRAYERNPIGIEQLDLPLDAQVDALNLDAVPYHRSGLVLRFPVKRATAATLRLVLDDGRDLPAGAQVRLNGQSEAFPVGYGGQVYLNGLSADNHITATWRGRSCDLAVPFAASDLPLPSLGTFVCKGVQP